MKVLGISCSLRKGSNSEILVKEALAGAKEAGAEIEFLTLIGKDIKPCDGCNSCTKTGECHINDDMQQIYEKLLAADGIVIGTPVYFFLMAGQTKVLLDRTYALRFPRLRLANKVGGVIVVATRNGVMSTSVPLYFSFASHHMFLADFVTGFARDKGAVRKDEFAMKEAWEMGRQVALLIGKRFEFPQEYAVPLYTYVEEKYGLRAAPYE